MLLALAAAAAVLAAARLVAVTAGCGSSPAQDLLSPDGHAERAVLAALGALVVTVLLVLLVHDDEPRVWLAGSPAPGEDSAAAPRDSVTPGAAADVAGGAPAGGVLLPAAALEEAARTAVAGHPDVLRTTAVASGDARRLCLSVRVAARPLVDADALGDELARRAETALRPLLGARRFESRVRVRAVRVRSLPRYLP